MARANYEKQPDAVVLAKADYVPNSIEPVKLA